MTEVNINFLRYFILCLRWRWCISLIYILETFNSHDLMIRKSKFWEIRLLVYDEDNI